MFEHLFEHRNRPQPVDRPGVSTTMQTIGRTHVVSPETGASPW
jgi:hypothetical protein